MTNRIRSLAHLSPKRSAGFLLLVLSITYVVASAALPTATTAATDPRVSRIAGIQGESEEAPASFEELKVQGALRSRYLNDEPSPAVTAEASQGRSSVEFFRAEIEPILADVCFRCHGSRRQKGGVRIDTLDPDLVTGDDVDWWVEVFQVLGNGEMPPDGDEDLPAQDRDRLIAWLGSEIQAASAARRAEEGSSSFRRMTRYEYNYALGDLLGLPFDFAKDLPPDPVAEDGFENSSELLQMSVSQLHAYRDAARSALLRATTSGPEPERLRWSVSMEAASASEWKKQGAQLETIREKQKDDPKKLEQALAKQTERFRSRPGRAHYWDRESGRFANAPWSYGGAKYAWKPTAEDPDVPTVGSIVAAVPRGQGLIVELGDKVPEEGTLRVRVRAWRGEGEGESPPSVHLEFGWQASNDSHASVRVSPRDIVVDAPPLEPRFYQWDVPLGEIYPRNSVRGISKLGDLPSPSEYVKLVNNSLSGGRVYLDYVEVTAPVYESWPPPSHERIFGSRVRDAKSGAKGDVSGERDDARRVLSTFMPRAWRRVIRTSEVDQKVELFAAIRPESDSFESAMVEVLATVLSSPKFLYLARSDRPTEEEEATDHGGDAFEIEDLELASRLSIFLWSSIPDEELLRVASRGELGDKEVLRYQVDRMLRDGRSQRFEQRFVRQWLGMQLLDFLRVDRKEHGHVDRALISAMKIEPVAFFGEVLAENRSVLDFVHADFAMVNERLADHYGIEGVRGNHMRRVPLDSSHRRGGLLSQAGLLAMNSDGKDSHPLKRGIWMLKSLLDDPPPPPPPAVPEIDLADPKIAEMTLRERIENHRDHPACMSCHAKIDPWGIAFENYDAVGEWRSDVRGEPVDAKSTLFNGQELDGMDGLKRFLLEHRQDQFVRAMVHKMMTYALGRPLGFGDRAAVDRITGDLREQGDGLATMVRLVVSSELFRHG